MIISNYMEHLHKQSAYVANRDAKGFVRMWKFNPKTGIKEILIEKPNLITKEGASIAARALSGLPNTGITHMYIEHISGSTPPTVTLDDTITAFGQNFLRKKLAFSPSFSNETGYDSNLVYFSAYITGTEISSNLNIVSIGLVNAADPLSSAGDKLFSRVSFTAIPYDHDHGLAITWGVSFRAQELPS
jgi:hypothetical protein